jgi:hypothetical protein
MTRQLVPIEALFSLSYAYPFQPYQGGDLERGSGRAGGPVGGSNARHTRLRQMLQEPGIIATPGAYDCLTAKIIQQAGFPAVYMTGGTSVSRLGYPDLALVTASEMIANAAEIVVAVDVPVIADADTGYGRVLNVQRTIRQYERAGVAAVHIEDQEFPNAADTWTTNEWSQLQICRRKSGQRWTPGPTRISSSSSALMLWR